MEEDKSKDGRLEYLTEAQLIELYKVVSRVVPEFSEHQVAYPKAAYKAEVVRRLVDIIGDDLEEKTLLIAMLVSYMGPKMMKSLLNNINMMKKVKEICDEYRNKTRKK